MTPRVNPILVAIIVASLAGQVGARADDSRTFVRDVLPILQEHCQSCHRPGQIAPMSLLDYRSVRPWAKAIRKAVLDRSMPPFPAAGPIGFYEGDTRLTDEEVATIVSWVDGGAARGAVEDAPSPVEWPSGSGQIVNPDLVIGFPNVTSSPGNEDRWALLYSDHVFEEETWVESYELVASDASLIHHALVRTADETFHIPEGRVSYGNINDVPRLVKKTAKNIDLFKQMTSLDTWFPGLGIQRRPGGLFRIPAGERILIKAHIAPTPEARTTDLSIALRLANGELATRIFETRVKFKEIEIQPGEAAYTLRGERKIAGAGFLRTVWVHMHERGKSVRVTLRYPNGESKIVLDIPRWDFAWQRRYHLTTPIPVPQGTRMEAVAVWDNSKHNPNNPDPSALIKEGPRTSDEMFFAVACISYYRPEPIVFEAGRLIRHSRSND